MTFQLVNLPFISSNIPASPAYAEFIFPNLYVILGLVPRAMIFLTELSCWNKNFSQKVMYSLSHNYKHASVSIITLFIAT
jgi:hypothetical protein